VEILIPRTERTVCRKGDEEEGMRRRPEEAVGVEFGSQEVTYNEAICSCSREPLFIDSRCDSDYFAVHEAKIALLRLISLGRKVCRGARGSETAANSTRCHQGWYNFHHNLLNRLVRDDFLRWWVSLGGWVGGQR
jgi:hypothetical protein